MSGVRPIRGARPLPGRFIFGGKTMEGAPTLGDGPRSYWPLGQKPPRESKGTGRKFPASSLLIRWGPHTQPSPPPARVPKRTQMTKPFAPECARLLTPSSCPWTVRHIGEPANCYPSAFPLSNPWVLSPKDHGGAPTTRLSLESEGRPRQSGSWFSQVARPWDMLRLLLHEL